LFEAQCLWQQGELLGYFLAMRGVEEMHLLNITVAPDRQGQGWGRKMLDALSLGSQREGAQWLWLEVRQSNQRAFKVYERYGFKTVSLNDKERMFVIVMGWSKDLAAKTRALANALDTPRTPGTQPAAVSGADADERRRLGEQSGTLPGAKGFFDQ
jgi:hypothetical protein